MIKKRIIFTLLFYDDYYVLSRNFRLQKVGNLNWLKKNYNFKKTAFSLDELIILNVRPQESNFELFCKNVKEISKDCFIPISAGGGINDIDQAYKLLKSGADKIVINSILNDNKKLVEKLSKNYGKQCIVASVDFKNIEKEYCVYINSGSKKIDLTLKEYIRYISKLPIGELFLNSIDNDGTGQGLVTNALNQLPNFLDIPLIFTGGVGNWHHIYEGLIDKRVDAVSTANLFNFVNDGLSKARKEIHNSGIPIPLWE